jgi:hypothetical protein
MAKADLNKLFKSLHGKVGELVFREMPNGSIVVSSAPKRSAKAVSARRRTATGPSRTGPSGPSRPSTNTRSTPSWQPSGR